MNSLRMELRFKDQTQAQCIHTMLPQHGLRQGNREQFSHYHCATSMDFGNLQKKSNLNESAVDFPSFFVIREKSEICCRINTNMVLHI